MRSIYVGDIISIEITSLDFSEGELREKFQDFEVVDIIHKKDGYLLSVRTFFTGEHIIILGDKEIIIEVVSTLEEIQRDDIFEAEGYIPASEAAIPWFVFLFVALGIFAVSAVLFFRTKLRKRREGSEGFYEKFLRRSAALLPENENYFVDLTFFFKEYIGGIYSRRIIGKTSAEIGEELSEIPALEPMMGDIKDWLKKCDMFKFSGVEVSVFERQEHYALLLRIVERVKEGFSMQEKNLSLDDVGVAS